MKNILVFATLYLMFAVNSFAANALILNGQVVQVSNTTFPVHPELQWVTCPEGVAAGWSYDGSKFVAPAPEPQPTIEEWRQTASVGPLTLAERLQAAGQFDAVNAWANAQGGMVTYAWNRATEFQRLHPMVLAAQQQFGWTDEQVDELFRLAATK